MKIGSNEPRVVKKGFEETTLDVPEGETYWIVQIDKIGQMDVEKQVEAELLSRLVRVELKLDKLLNQKKVEAKNGKDKSTQINR